MPRPRKRRQNTTTVTSYAANPTGASTGAPLTTITGVGNAFDLAIR